MDGYKISPLVTVVTGLTAKSLLVADRDSIFIVNSEQSVRSSVRLDKIIVEGKIVTRNNIEPSHGYSILRSNRIIGREKTSGFWGTLNLLGYNEIPFIFSGTPLISKDESYQDVIIMNGTTDENSYNSLESVVIANNTVQFQSERKVKFIETHGPGKCLCSGVAVMSRPIRLINRNFTRSVEVGNGLHDFDLKAVVRGNELYTVFMQDGVTLVLDGEMNIKYRI